MKHLTAEEADLYYTTSFTEVKSSTSPRTYSAKVSLNPIHPYKSLPPKPQLEPASPPSPLSDDNDDDQKKVRFGHVYKRTYHHRTKTKSERKNLWYSGRDIRNMRTQICALNMSAASLPPDQRSLLLQAYETVESWRGLEHAKEGLLLQRVEHRRNFAQAFLYFSQELGVSDPEALAVFSATNSKLDRERAVALAQQDAVDASQIYSTFLTEELPLQTPYRRGRRPSKGTPRHHSETKTPLQPQIFNLTRSL